MLSDLIIESAVFAVSPLLNVLTNKKVIYKKGSTIIKAN